MSKRGADREDSPYSKRQKLASQSQDASVQTIPEDIISWADLKRLLAFDQDAGPRAHQNVRAFKGFLDSTAYSEDDVAKSANRSLLHEYLRRTSANTSVLADLIRTWSSADQSNDERLFAAITAVLALFLKTTSSHIEFRDFGNQLCRALLEDDCLRLFKRGLGTKKIREHVVSPCLRLLTEIVAHDGGTAAKLLWHKSDIVFHGLEIFLTLPKEKADDWKPSRRESSIRDNALRYLFANLRLQSPIAKEGIVSLAQGRPARPEKSTSYRLRNTFLAPAAVQSLADDSPGILVELLNVLKQHVLADADLPRNVKRALFKEETVAGIAALYNYGANPDASEQPLRVRETAHIFLLFLCTSPIAGLLEPERTHQAYGLESAANESNGFTCGRRPSSASVRGNKVLSSFLQGLRPYANRLEEELVLAIFEASPDMIAEYFERKKSFSFEPKLSATWIGYAKFLTSTILLPLPRSFIQEADTFPSRLAVPASTIIESILPSPLSQKSLMRCLNQNIDLVKLFAVRIITFAFQKLESLTDMFSISSRETGLSFDASKTDNFRHLVYEFRRRCPEVRHVIAGFRRCPKKSVVQREAFCRLLVYYYRLIPQSALEEKFDISVALSDALLGNESPSNRSLRSLELGSLLEIARRSPDMQWWHKSENASLSPFTTLLRIYCRDQQKGPEKSLRDLLQLISEEYHVLSRTHESSIDVLCRSLQEPVASVELYEYLDNCIQQLVKKSVKYYEQFNSLATERGLSLEKPKRHDVDLLFVAIADQWPFLFKEPSPAKIALITTWVVSYLDLSMQAGRDHEFLILVRDMIVQSTQDTAGRSALEQALQVSSLVASDKPISRDGNKDQAVVTTSSGSETTGQELFRDLEPPEEEKEHKVLTSWIHESIPDIVVEGAMGKLTLYLCSRHEDIRKQALYALRKLRDSLRDSDWAEASHVHMLVGETVETVEHLAFEEPFPYFAGVFAAHCFPVQADPSHPMYLKVNKFLLKGPRWRLDKLLSYWIDKILLQPPTEDDGLHAETEWLLSFLLDALRTPRDMETYRRSNVMERLLSLAASRSLPAHIRQKIIQLCYRCTFVNGSTTLVTRCGLLSWIRSEISNNQTQRQILRSLAVQVHKTCDLKRISDWSGQDSVFAGLDIP